MVVAGLAPAMPDCTLSFIRQQSLPGGILWWSQLYCLSGSPAHVVLLANLIKKASVSVVATIQSSLARTSYHVWARWVQIAPSASFESRLSSSTGSAEEPECAARQREPDTNVCRHHAREQVSAG